MKPRRCGNHVYSTVVPSSFAISVASSFSKPSPCSSENGRLFGSEHTRSGSCVAAPAGEHAAAASMTTRALEAEHIDHISWARVLLDVLHRADDAERRVRIVGGDIRERDRAHPAA